MFSIAIARRFTLWLFSTFLLGLSIGLVFAGMTVSDLTWGDLATLGIFMLSVSFLWIAEKT